MSTQGMLLSNAGRTAIKEQHRLNGAHDGDAVFHVSVALEVATGEADGVAEDRHVDGSLGRLTEAIQAGATKIGKLLIGGHGNKSDRGDEANIEAADIRFAAHVEAAIGRRFAAAIAGDKSARSVQAQNVAALVHRMVQLPIKDVGDALDIAAERTAGERRRIEVALPASGVNGMVDGVIGNRGCDGAGDDSVERAGTGDAAELQLREQQLGGFVEGRDIRARETVLKANSREREPSNGIAGKEREASAVLIVVLNELRGDADGLPERESRRPGLVKFVAAGENR